MTTVHTETPWTSQESGEANEFLLLDSNGHWLAVVRFNGEQVIDRQRANVELIIRTVNEYPAMLEKLALAGQEVGKLEAVNQVLVTALTDAMPFISNPMSGQDIKARGYEALEIAGVPYASQSGIAVATKWKQFALSQILSDFEDADNTLFDLMISTNKEELPALFEKHDVVVWQPFEHLSESDVVYEIMTLAESAQKVGA